LWRAIDTTSNVMCFGDFVRLLQIDPDVVILEFSECKKARSDVFGIRDGELPVGSPQNS
jgi:hypothetical protein